MQIIDFFWMVDWCRGVKLPATLSALKSAPSRSSYELEDAMIGT